MPSPRGLTSVVVPTDFSESASRALARAMELPLAAKAKLTLLHVLHDDIPGTLRKQAISEAERSLEKLMARARQHAIAKGQAGLKVVGDVLEGEPAQQIIKRSHTVEADVVCLGRHGRRALVDLFLGSTVQKVARAGDIPVLVVQLPPDRPYHRPLAAVDLESGAAKVVAAAGKLLGAGARWMDLLHCVEIGFDDFVTLEAPESHRLREVRTTQAERSLGSLGKKARLAIETKPEVKAGDARALILDAEKQHRTDLLAVGTHGRKGVKRILLGSVAEWVLTRAKCDVLVVPAA